MTAALNAVAEERAVANAARPYGLSFPWDNLYFYHFSKRCVNVNVNAEAQLTFAGAERLVKETQHLCTTVKFVNFFHQELCWFVGWLVTRSAPSYS